MQDTRAEREWLELFAELMTTPLAAVPTEQLALRLCETFESTACSFEDILHGERRRSELWPRDEQLGGHRGELYEWACAHGHQHPLLRFHLITGHRRPVQSADVPAEVVGRESARAWDDIGAVVGCPDQLALPLRLQPGGARAFVLGRAGRFRPPEIALARILWRLLTALDLQVAALQRAAATPAAAIPATHPTAASPATAVAGCGARDPAGLTPRETAVLALLGDGLTARAIASRLAISERTVHKHLERVYVKLEVADRLSAVMRARERSLIPG